MGDNLTVVDLGDGFLVADVSLGRDFSCTLSLVGSLKCFGGNGNGQVCAMFDQIFRVEKVHLRRHDQTVRLLVCPCSFLVFECVSYSVFECAHLFDDETESLLCSNTIARTRHNDI